MAFSPKEIFTFVKDLKPQDKQLAELMPHITFSVSLSAFFSGLFLSGDKKKSHPRNTHKKNVYNRRNHSVILLKYQQKIGIALALPNLIATGLNVDL